MILSLISAIANNNEIGKKNDLLWNLPADMKHFRETTSGHPVIMGQKTFESLGRTSTGEQVGKPLPNRRNIVISREMDYTAPGIEVVHSIDEAIELCKKSENINEEFFVIGGGEIYRQMIEKADKLYITHVEATFPDAEVFFPPIGQEWQEVSRDSHESDEKNAFPYSFVVYEKIDKKS